MKRSFITVIFLTFICYFSCEISHGLHPVPLTGISGKITFLGDWPEDIDMLRLVCFAEKPNQDNMIDLVLKLMESKIGDELPRNVEQIPYEMELDPGTYDWIIVILSTKNFPFTVLGEFTGSDTSNSPIPVTVEKEKLITNVDIRADFNKLNTLPLDPSVTMIIKRFLAHE